MNQPYIVCQQEVSYKLKISLIKACNVLDNKEFKSADDVKYEKILNMMISEISLSLQNNVNHVTPLIIETKKTHKDWSEVKQVLSYVKTEAPLLDTGAKSKVLNKSYVTPIIPSSDNLENNFDYFNQNYSAIQEEARALKIKHVKEYPGSRAKVIRTSQSGVWDEFPPKVEFVKEIALNNIT